MTTKINGRTPEEIKKGLECCKVIDACDDCPYHGFPCLSEELAADALAYIQQLERERAEAQKDIDMLGEQAVALDSAYDAMKRERDAAVDDLTLACVNNNPCLVCGHYRPDRDGMQKCELNEWVCRWVWRGEQNEHD